MTSSDIRGSSAPIYIQNSGSSNTNSNNVATRVNFATVSMYLSHNTAFSRSIFFLAAAVPGEDVNVEDTKAGKWTIFQGSSFTPPGARCPHARFRLFHFVQISARVCVRRLNVRSNNSWNWILVSSSSIDEAKFIAIHPENRSRHHKLYSRSGNGISSKMVCKSLISRAM